MQSETNMADVQDHLSDILEAHSRNSHRFINRPGMFYNNTTTRTRITLRNTETPEGSQQENAYPTNENPIGLGLFPTRQGQSLRRLLRWLLLFDKLMLAVLLPITLYNVTSILMSEVTHTRFGLIDEIVSYWFGVRVLKRDVSTSEISLLYISNDSYGLLSKFHNIIVYYTQNYISTVFLKNQNYTTSFAVDFLFSWYPFLVKSCTSLLFLVYAIWTTLYLWIAIAFFCICLGISLIRRYSSVVQMIFKMLLCGNI